MDDIKPGTQIEVASNKVGSPPRRGKVAEVVDADRGELRVEWDDGSTSNLYPAGGMIRVVNGA